MGGEETENVEGRLLNGTKSGCRNLLYDDLCSDLANKAYNDEQRNRNST